MLRARHGSAPSPTSSNHLVDTKNIDDAGASSGGMLLYLNHESFVARHVRPSQTDVKTLVGQRNAVAADARRARRPRGVKLQLEEGDGPRTRLVVADPPPPTDLPPLHRDAGGCARCYRNRECMMYHASDAVDGPAAVLTGDHSQLLSHFAGHLTGTDLDYFRKWDRLVDLERHACAKDGTKTAAWLSGPKEGGGCITSLVLDGEYDGGRGGDGDEDAIVRLRRPNDGNPNGPPAPSLADSGLEAGSYCVVSSERQDNDVDETLDGRRRAGAATVRNAKTVHLLRAKVASVRPDSVELSVPRKDVGRLVRLASANATFRVDRDEMSNGTGLLLQNLVNFFTLDIPAFSVESAGSKTPSLTVSARDLFATILLARVCSLLF